MAGQQASSDRVNLVNFHQQLAMPGPEPLLALGLAAHRSHVDITP